MMWDEFGHSSGRLFNSFKHIKLGKSGYSRRLSQQRWGHTRHPGDESGAKGEGTAWWDGKMVSNFLVVVSREALCLALMSYKHTCNTLNAKMAAGLIFFCLN